MEKKQTVSSNRSKSPQKKVIDRAMQEAIRKDFPSGSMTSETYGYHSPHQNALRAKRTHSDKEMERAEYHDERHRTQPLFGVPGRYPLMGGNVDRLKKARAAEGQAKLINQPPGSDAMKIRRREESRKEESNELRKRKTKD